MSENRREMDGEAAGAPVPTASPVPAAPVITLLGAGSWSASEAGPGADSTDAAAMMCVDGVCAVPTAVNIEGERDAYSGENGTSSRR